MKKMSFGKNLKTRSSAAVVDFEHVLDRSSNNLKLLLETCQVWERMILIFLLQWSFSTFCRGVLNLARTFIREKGAVKSP